MIRRLGPVIAVLVPALFGAFWALVPISRLREKTGRLDPVLVHRHLVSGVLPRLAVAALLAAWVLSRFRQGRAPGYVAAFIALPLLLAADLALGALGAR